MVLINIDTLSDEEIRYIAQQEGLDNWDTLSREELIEYLEELYEEDTPAKTAADSLTRKYVNKLTDSNSDVSALPDVEPVSDTYNETYIHLVPKDRNWVYAFWEISENVMSSVKEGAEFLLVAKAVKSGKNPEESYEIKISPNDKSWSLELPWSSRKYVLSLVIRTDGQDEILCSTEKYNVPEIYLSKHPEVLNDPTAYHILVSSMQSKDGSLINNDTVREIVKNA